MDLLGRDISQKEVKTKKTIKLITIILIILFIISMGLGIYIYYLQSLQLKVTIDGKSMSLETAQQLFLFDEQDENKVYISIKDIATHFGYSAYNGEYKQYSEDTNSCYIQNAHEVATYTKGSDRLYKLLTDGEDYEYFTIDEPVKMIDNKLYTTPDGISIGANISFVYDAQKNSITIYTLDYLTNSYANAFQNADITGDKADFSNKKALLYERLVVKNADGKYGVTDLKGNTIIGEKYDTIQFLESSKEFIVTTSDKKMGIISYDAVTVIQPEYDEIKQIDKDLDLYLVTNNKKQGVINKNGKFIVYMEYDQIGIDATDFVSNNIKNQYLLYDNCIPVKRDKYWGMIDKNGNEILPVMYDCLGSSVKDRTSNSVLLIPDYELVVVKGPIDNQTGTVVGEQKNTLYGLVDKYGKTVVRNVLEEVYSITNAGEDTYYMTFNGQKIGVEEYFAQYGHMVNNQPEETQNTVEQEEEVQIQEETSEPMTQMPTDTVKEPEAEEVSEAEAEE